MRLYLLKHANYYNRIVKPGDITEYKNNNELCLPGLNQENPIRSVNFIPNDGVSTEQDINWTGETPDYVVVVGDYTDDIVSRWYVIESVRLRSGQFRLSLMRDLLVDYLPEIRQAPCFIEKGILSQNSNLIFNKEDIQVNQIKQKQWMIKDDSNCAWIVGYTASNTNPTHRVFSVPTSETTLVATTEGWGFYKYSNLAGDDQEPLIIPEEVDYQLYAKRQNSNLECYAFSFNKNGPTESEFTGTSGVGKYNDTGSQTNYNLNVEASAVNIYNFPSWLGSSLPDTIDAVAKQQFANQFFPGTIASLNDIDGKTILFSDTNLAYKITVETNSNETVHLDVPVNTATFRLLEETYNTANTNYNLSGNGLYGSASTGSFSVEFSGQNYSLYLEPTTTNSVSVEFPEASVLPDLEDAPYQMFAIPYGSIEIINKISGVSEAITDSNIAMKLAQQIAVQGGEWLYDIQLLPFAPLDDVLGPTVGSVYAEGTENIDYTFIRDTNDVKKSIVFFPKKASFSKFYNLTTGMKDSINEMNNLATTNSKGLAKLESECDLWRIVSPNENGIFEFSRPKIGGRIQGFMYYFTYRPFTPYIQVAPLFSGLYKQTFQKDSRGLICGGDFSLPRVNNNWINYELQNKNYEKTFQRQIDSMEYMNNIQRGIDIASAIAGTASGGLSGGVATQLGLNKGGVAGGIVSGLFSGIGGIADVILNEQIRREQINLAKDQYGYNLGNIKAQPQSLAKISAFSVNNKIFPYIEYYTCSQEERDAVYNKIKYNGMTVMAIGNISEYMNNKLPDEKYTYIQGRFIRLEGLGDDSHIANAINAELSKGVFM